MIWFVFLLPIGLATVIGAVAGFSTQNHWVSAGVSAAVTIVIFLLIGRMAEK